MLAQTLFVNVLNYTVILDSTNNANDISYNVNIIPSIILVNNDHVKLTQQRESPITFQLERTGKS